ncbi:hypothetical protein [Pleurocapsa sp. FMAR1]|uniref:hypothetical protein n=1 Tax=Pleurocapsa sp. FMAR1 TaxID=3040204 RepID=UPI0029C756DF|nr:hypothetical protein [Pleurocapsa sp. FMAR1]
MLKKLLLSCAITASMVAPAYANWQFTEWGMSRDDLWKSSPIAMRKDSTLTKCAHSYYESDWQAGKLKFIACYGFDPANDSLNKIQLHLKDYSERDSFYDALVAKYGQPKINTNLKEIRLIFYEWRSDTSLITLVDNRFETGNPEMYIDYESSESNIETENKL